MSRFQRKQGRPAGIVVACIIDWVVLSLVALFLFLGSAVAASALPSLAAVARLLAFVCVLIMALDVACFTLQVWAIWVRVVLQALAFVSFALDPGSASLLVWVTHVAMLGSWVGALAEISRARARDREQGDRTARGPRRRAIAGRGRFR